MKLKLISAILVCALLTDCATIHRHPKATAFIVSAAVGAVVGAKLGYRKPCPHYISGVPYDGTPPCPVYCDSPGHCDWPGGKK